MRTLGKHEVSWHFRVLLQVSETLCYLREHESHFHPKFHVLPSVCSREQSLLVLSVILKGNISFLCHSISEQHHSANAHADFGSECASDGDADFDANNDEGTASNRETKSSSNTEANEGTDSCANEGADSNIDFVTDAGANTEAKSRSNTRSVEGTDSCANEGTDRGGYKGADFAPVTRSNEVTFAMADEGTGIGAHIGDNSQ